MRTVAVSWDKREGRFVAHGTHARREIHINAPAEPGSGRPPTGFSATELLLAGAGACAAWDTLEILRKRRARVSALEVTVEGEQLPDPPWTYLRIHLHFHVTCNEMRLPVLARIIRLSIVRYCSVITTVAGVAAIEATVELVTDIGATSGRHPIELALPYVAPRNLADADSRELGISQPSIDED
jgi:putative redox protein